MPTFVVRFYFFMMTDSLEISHYKVVFPSDLKTEDYYPMPDMHFNNKGHKKYYESIKCI